MDARPERYFALDALRGLTVLLMIPVNAAAEFDRIPSWWKHAPGAGMNLADFIMPAFLVALGLSSSFSLRRRLERDGLLKTCLHALLRYGLLFLFGTIGYVIVWRGGAWEVLQMLGATGALAFPFLFLPPPARAASAVVLAASVEALRPAFFDAAYRAWHESGLGGPAGTFALAALPVAASALGERIKDAPWKRRATALAGVGAAAAAFGLLAAAFAAPDKHLLTPAYLLLSFAAACLALAVLEPLCAAAGDLPVLGPMGRNALFGYMASGVLTLAARAFVPAGSPAPVAWGVSMAPALLIAAACVVMDRKRLWLKL